MGKYSLLCLFLILFISCESENKINTIGETEYYFDEKLSSISLDNSGNFWVGSETGDLFNFKNNSRITYDLGEDRIYKVSTETNSSGDSLFWIGIRNSGFQKWKKSGSQLQKIETYSIKFKQDRYSPYDFVTIGNIIYLATSQGVYSIDKNEASNALSIIYPSEESGNSFIIHNICQYNDNILLASTPKGVLSYNIKDKKKSFFLEGQSIEHVSVYNDTIFSISNKYLYRHTIEGELIDQIKTSNGAKLYYQIHGVHYLVGTELLLLSNNLKDFLQIQLRRTVPTSCRNIIVPDSLNNFTYLLTENAVWKIPYNIDIFKGSKSFKASFSNAENTYYLSLNNELYVQNKNSNNAKWIYTFDDDNLVQWIDISGDKLYFYNTNNEFQKMKISHNWIKNMLYNSPTTIVKPKERITSAKTKSIEDKTFTYLGIQDGMLTIDNNNKIDTISELGSVYITAMFTHKNTDRIYASTLNDGVFYLDQTHQVNHIEETRNTYFIEDIITTNSHVSNLIALTNQKIKSYNPKDSLRVKGYKKLLYVNDTLFYALPEFGIQKFGIQNNKLVDKGIFYKDIRFSKNSSYSIDNKLNLASNVGTLSLSPDNELNPIWIHFDNVINIDILTYLFFALILFILTVSTFLFFLRKHNYKIAQTLGKQEELSKRVKNLMIYYNGLEDPQYQDLSNLKKLINSIEINSKKRKEANLLLDDFSIQIAQLNRDIALHIPKKLEEQISIMEQFDLTEKDKLINASVKARDYGDIENIKDRIKTNQAWLQQANLLYENLEKSIENLSNTVEIQDLNKGVYDKLVDIRNNKSSLLSDLITSYEILKQDIQNIESIKASEIIVQHIAEAEKYSTSRFEHDKKSSFLIDIIDEIKIEQQSLDNLSILKKLKPLDEQLLILKTLDRIKNCTDKYREIHDRIVKDNKNQIIKKFEDDLTAVISEQTQDISKTTNSLVEELYQLLQDTDSSVLETLKLNNTEGQHAKVLALLIADPKIKRTLIPRILGIFGNLNPVISRLINERIKPNETQLLAYQKSHNGRSAFVLLILNLLD